MRICCSSCGKTVSTEVPDGTIIRAYIECPECIEKPPKTFKWAEGNEEVSGDK